MSCTIVIDAYFGKILYRDIFCLLTGRHHYYLGWLHDCHRSGSSLQNNISEEGSSKINHTERLLPFPLPDFGKEQMNMVIRALPVSCALDGPGWWKPAFPCIFHLNGPSCSLVFLLIPAFFFKSRGFTQ